MGTSTNGDAGEGLSVDAEPAAEYDAMKTQQIKIEVAGKKAGDGLPLQAKLAHLLALVVSGVIAVAVSIVLADGGSVIKLKDIKDLPVVTAPSLKDTYGINYRLDELLGPTYGIGLHHDQSGRTWDEVGAGETLTEIVNNLGLHAVAGAVPYVVAHDKLKHPVPLLECHDLKMAGFAAMSLGFIADHVAVVMLIFHALALAGLVPAKLGKQLAALVWFVLTTGFLAVVCLAVGIYDADWKCNNIIIPYIKLSEHFDYNYGFPFAIVGYISALLIFCVTLVFTSTTDGDGSDRPFALKPALVKTSCGLFTGLVVAGSAILIVMGSNNFYDDKPLDPMLDPINNPCKGQKPKHADYSNGGAGDNYFKNTQCMKDNMVVVLEQAGANVTRGFRGLMPAGARTPIIDDYWNTDLCPVNVHWHLGAEHLSEGEYDLKGVGPKKNDKYKREYASGAPEKEYNTMELGQRCHYYDSKDQRFNDSTYKWKYCTKTVVGETYEVHWPHSAAGACGTKWQFQSPFYDGVFCKDGIISLAPLNTYSKVGVQGQVFTIINDESYYYPNLMAGAWVDALHWRDVAKYTGSTTGTSRDNDVCSRYTPITWQVDRKCHLVSASSFDKMCADMMLVGDDMSMDTHPHGARELVADYLVANNQVTRKK